MNTFKNKKADLKSYYTIFLEIGLILSLSLMLVSTKLEINPTERIYTGRKAGEHQNGGDCQHQTGCKTSQCTTPSGSGCGSQ